MKSIYLIHAKTDGVINLLKKEGAIPFSSDTFLWDENPLSPIRANQGKPIPVAELTVLDIFVPNKTNSIHHDHPQKEALQELLVDLHRAAFFWARKHENAGE